MRNEAIQNGFSFFGGCLAFLVGGFDSLLVALVVVMVIDWVTGAMKALKKGKYSGSVGLWGIANKAAVLLVVSMVNFVQIGLALQLPLRETVIVMLLINEALSVLGNASTFVKGLEPLTKYFETVKVNVIKIFTVGEKVG